MKKVIAAFLICVLSMLLLTACGGGEEQEEEEKTYDVNEVLSAIEEVATVRMATEVDKEYMDFIGLTEDMYDEYAGSYCPITPGVDIILVVHAKSGMVEDVRNALEARRQEIYASNENYVGALKDKAEAGRVVTKGNYVVLAIAGDETVVEDEGVEKAYEPIDKAIDEAFN